MTISYRATTDRRDSALAGREEWTRRLAGVGLVARSVLYAVIGVLVLQVAYGADRRRTDSNGAFHALARQPLGRALLVVLALGLAAYALWRFVEAANVHPDREHDGIIRLVDAGRGLVYSGLCALCIATIFSAQQTRQRGQEQRATAVVLDWPGGRLLVGAIGIAIVVGGVANAWHLLNGSWRDNIDLGRLRASTRTAVTAVAIAGLTARVFVYFAVGAFVIQAAVEHEPRKSAGLDIALHRLARAEWGTWILTAVAVGMLAYAVYSIVEAILRPSPEA